MRSSVQGKPIHPKILCVLLLWVTALPLTLFVNAVPVGGAGLTLAPSEGVVGTTVEINGTGFAGISATIKWDDTTILTDVPVSATGELTAKLKIPAACGGNHDIMVTDDGNASNTESEIFTVLPNAMIFPRMGPANTRLTVFGTGFSAFEKDIKTTWDGNVLPSPATTNHVGSWSIDFFIPSATKGPHAVGVIGNTTDTSEIDNMEFMLTLFAKVEPTSGPVGTKISIRAFGFRPNEDGITILWDRKIIVCNLIAATDGNFNTTLSIPRSPGGRHVLGIYGSDFTPIGVIPDTDFNVTPKIELQPASGIKGTKLNVVGTGFSDGETIDLSFNELPIGAQTTADKTGSFSATFEVPQTPVRDNKVVATGGGGSIAQTIFASDKIAPSAPKLLFPEPGMKLETFPSVGDVFNGIIKRLIGIAALRNTPQRSFLTPKVTFEWNDPGNGSQMTYNLEIARDGDFSSPTLIRSIVAQSKYNLANKDILEQGKYSWRVEAVDDVGNESPWSAAQEFEVVPISEHVSALSLAIAVFVILAIVGGSIAIWSRHRIAT